MGAPASKKLRSTPRSFAHLRARRILTRLPLVLPPRFEGKVVVCSGSKAGYVEVLQPRAEPAVKAANATKREEVFSAQLNLPKAVRGVCDSWSILSKRGEDMLVRVMSGGLGTSHWP